MIASTYGHICADCTTFFPKNRQSIQTQCLYGPMETSTKKVKVRGVGLVDHSPCGPDPRIQHGLLSSTALGKRLRLELRDHALEHRRPLVGVRRPMAGVPVRCPSWGRISRIWTRVPEARRDQEGPHLFICHEHELQDQFPADLGLGSALQIFLHQPQGRLG